MSATVDHKGNVVTFAMPGGQGQFRGRLTDGNIEGVWIQPPGQALASAYATPLALALTELVTNAVEHGLAGREGEVEIIADRNQERLSVIVRDNGIGLAEGKVGTGLGTQIVRTLIQGELGGTIDWHTVMGSGTEVTIEIPLVWLTSKTS